MGYFSSAMKTSPEGSLEDSAKIADQVARRTGSPNADWPVQRRFYSRKMSDDIGPPIAPPEPYRRGGDREYDY